MTHDRFRRIRELFEAALAVPEPQRSAFIEESCGKDITLRDEVERLLAAHRNVNAVVDRPALSPDATLNLRENPRGDAWIGRRLGPWEIVREIGRGGMAVVYLARRADQAFDKEVALKLVGGLPGSEEIVRRFQNEREILAALDHPHIARLLDGGNSAEGVPYLVMEYVEGIPIDQYCDENRLTINARLKLFQQVCAAVEYAHQRSVIHRDLKPGNILVTNEGTVKLLDFGIAKLLHTESEGTLFLTRSGLHLMTPEYASPEQVKGENVTAATDVYALGIVLYELLTGHRPYRIKTRVLHELARIICEEEPTRPSTVIMQSDEPGGERRASASSTPESVSRARQTTPIRLRWRLFGDMDSVLLKCLRKEPARRYASAASLSEDLDRYLNGTPVLAYTGWFSHWSGTLIRRAPAWIAVGFLILALRIHLLPALVIGLAIPLVIRAVPPNRWYGVRTPQTFSSLSTWYKVNHTVGWWMITAAALVICFSLILWRLHPEWPASKLNYWTNSAMCLLILLIALSAIVYARRF